MINMNVFYPRNVVRNNILFFAVNLLKLLIKFAESTTCQVENEVYSTCGTFCPLTCQNKDGPAFLCIASCAKGCFCDKGYIRDEITNKCVLPENCPPGKSFFPANEAFVPKKHPFSTLLLLPLSD